MLHSRKSLLRQSGQSATEFIIIVPVAFTLIFGCLQLALIYQAKTTLNYAAFSAARLASVHHGTFEWARRGFVIGMAPFYTYEKKAMVAAEAQNIVNDQVKYGYVKIVRINPTVSAFNEFGEKAVKDDAFDDADPNGMTQIPNDNLLFRDSSAVGGGTNIQDANLLKIAVVYCYHLSFPFVREIIYNAVVAGNFGRGGVLDHDCTALTPRAAIDSDKYFIPLRASAIVRMQNAAWDDLANWTKDPPYGDSAHNFINLGSSASGGISITEDPEPQ